MSLRQTSGSVQFRGQVFRPLLISDDGREKGGMSEPRQRAGPGHLESHCISMSYEAKMSDADSGQIRREYYKPLIYNSFPTWNAARIRDLDILSSSIVRWRGGESPIVLDMARNSSYWLSHGHGAALPGAMASTYKPHGVRSGSHPVRWIAGIHFPPARSALPPRACHAAVGRTYTVRGRSSQ